MFRDSLTYWFLFISAVCGMAFASSGYAQDSNRVPRIMVIWETGNQVDGLDWEGEDSVAMVVMGTTNDSGVFQTTAIENNLGSLYSTIEANQPELSEVEVFFLATALYDSLEDGTFYKEPETQHIRQGIPELVNIYWSQSIPQSGALAEAGPTGDITVLGNFYFKPNSDLSYPGTTSDFRLTSPSNATHTAKIAIGWFTK